MAEERESFETEPTFELPFDSTYFSEEKDPNRTYSIDMILIKEDPYKLIYTYEHETKEKDYGKNLRFEKWIKKNFTLKNLSFGWHLKYPSYYNKEMTAAHSGWLYPAIDSAMLPTSLRGYESRIIDGNNCGVYGVRNKNGPETCGSIANIIWIDPPIKLEDNEKLKLIIDRRNSSSVHILRAAAIASDSQGNRKIFDLKEIKSFNLFAGEEERTLSEGALTLKTLIWGSEELYDRFNPISPVETNSTSITIEDQEGTVVQNFFNSKFVTSNVCGTIASQYGKSLGAFVLPEDFLDLYFQASNSNPLKFIWEVRNLSEYPVVYNLYLIGSYKTEFQKTYSVDVLLKKPIKRDFLIDIYLYLRRKQFQIDAWILRKPFLLFDTDMILRKSPFAAYPIDSMLVKARHKSFGIDSLLMLSKIKEIYSDMILKALPVLDYYADTILTLWHRKDYNVDSAVLKRIEKELKSDLIILTRQIKEFSQDLLLKKSFNLSFLADMITKKAEKLVYNIDSLLKKGFSKDFETDMLLKESFVLIFQMDAILKKLISKEYETDIVLKKALETDYWTDTLVKASLLIDYLNDAIVVLSKKKDYQIDLRLLKKSLKDFENDIILLKSLTRDFRIDLFLTGKSQRFYSIDALIKASKTKNFLSDLILVLSGLKGYFADLILTSPFRREMNIDSILKKSLIRGFSIDTILKGMYERSYLSDALLMRTRYNDYLADALLSKGKASPFFIDALIKSSIRKIFNIDLRLVRAVRKDFYSDIALKRAYLKGYAIDTFLYASLKQYNIDMILAKMFPREKIIKYSAELITPKKDYISHVEIPAEEGEVTKIKKKESETY